MWGSEILDVLGVSIWVFLTTIVSHLLLFTWQNSSHIINYTSWLHVKICWCGLNFVTWDQKYSLSWSTFSTDFSMSSGELWFPSPRDVYRSIKEFNSWRIRTKLSCHVWGSEIFGVLDARVWVWVFSPSSYYTFLLLKVLSNCLHSLTHGRNVLDYVKNFGMPLCFVGMDLACDVRVYNIN